jgi:hypothetical protein
MIGTAAAYPVLFAACSLAMEFAIRHHNPDGAALQGVAAGGGHVIAVGGGGAILWSTAGTTWTRAQSGTSSNLRAIAHAGTRFVAVGDGGTVTWSNDGRSWRVAASVSTSAQLNAITFGAGMFVAVGNSGTILTSDDGDKWIARDSGVTSHLTTIAYAKAQRRFYAGGSLGAIRRSEDAVVWRPSTLQAMTDVVSIVWEPWRSELHVITSAGSEMISRDEQALRATGEIYMAGVFVADAQKTTGPVNCATAAAGTLYGFGANGLIHRETFTPIPTMRWTSAVSNTTADLYAAEWDGVFLWVVGKDETILQSPPLLPGRMANLSTRGWVRAPPDVLVAGFVVGGTEWRRMLVRAAGPALAGFHVAGAMPQVRLEVFDPHGRSVAENAGWDSAGAGPEIAEAAQRVGAFAFSPGSGDAAIVMHLAPGAYTAAVTSPFGIAGEALVEVYDVDPSASKARALANLATRGAIRDSGESLIAGVHIGGAGPRRLLVRAVGPSLTQFGVTAPLALPTLTLRTATFAGGPATPWSSSQADRLRAAAQLAGAFPLVEGSADVAWFVDLFPGDWTFHIRGASGSVGVALVELYDITSELAAAER